LDDNIITLYLFHRELNLNFQYLFYIELNLDFLNLFHIELNPDMHTCFSFDTIVILDDFFCLIEGKRKYLVAVLDLHTIFTFLLLYFHLANEENHLLVAETYQHIC